MKPHTIILALVLFAVLLFAGVNWGLFSRQDSISFIFFSIQAPLGVIMLGIVGLMSLLYMLFIGRAEIASLLEARKNSRELEAARRLAADSEKSRISELQAALSTRLDGLGGEFAVLKERFAGVEGRLGDIVRRFDEEGVFIVRGSNSDDEGGDETKK